MRAEEGLAELGDHDFVVVSMRNATVYGVSPRLRLDIVLNNLAGWAHTTGRIRLLSDGTFVAAAHPRPRPLGASRSRSSRRRTSSSAGEAFNVGSAEQNYLIRDLAGVLAEVTGCEIELAADASPDPRSYRVDFSRLERRVPRSALRVGLPSWIRGARRRLSCAAAHDGALRGSSVRAPTAAPTPSRQRRARGRAAVAAPRRCEGLVGVRFVATSIAGAVVVELERHEDERGFFARAWCREELAAAGLTRELSQARSRGRRAGRCAGCTSSGRRTKRRSSSAAREARSSTSWSTSGRIVDARTVVRDRARRRVRAALYIPEGCAHGFQTLLTDSDVLYVICAPYVPERHRECGGMTPSSASRGRTRRSASSAPATGRGRTTGRRPPDRRAGRAPRAGPRHPRSPRTAARSGARCRRGSCCRRQAQEPERRRLPARAAPDRPVEAPTTELRLAEGRRVDVGPVALEDVDDRRAACDTSQRAPRA